MAEDRFRLRSAAAAPTTGAEPSAPACAAGYRTELDETELIRRYVPVVKRLACHLKARLPHTVQLDDLVQAGLLAVLRMARRGDCRHHDPRGLRRTIVNAMIDEARRTAWAPVRTLRLARSAAAAIGAVRQRLGRDGNDEEIAGELGITLEQYHKVLVEITGVSLLDLAAFDDCAEPALQTEHGQDEVLGRSRVAAALAEAIRALPSRERLVLSLYYEQELNMEEVGQVLDLDKSTISRTHGRALVMLRHALAGWGAAAAQPNQRAGQ